MRRLQEMEAPATRWSLTTRFCNVPAGQYVAAVVTDDKTLVDVVD